MTVGDSFKCLKIVLGMEAMNRKASPQARNPSNEMIRIEQTVASSCFNNKTEKPNCQPSRTVKFMQ